MRTWKWMAATAACLLQISSSQCPAQNREPLTVLTGVVEDLSGAPVPGAEVMIHSEASADVHLRTGPNGVFHFRGVPGKFLIDATYQGFEPVHGQAVGFTKASLAPIVLRVGGGSVVHAEEEAPPSMAAPSPARTSPAALGGFVVDASGAAIPHATVVVRSGARVRASLLTASDGSFSAPPQQGLVQIEAEALGFSRLRVETDGAPAEPLRLVLQMSNDSWGSPASGPDLPLASPPASEALLGTPAVPGLPSNASSVWQPGWEFGVQASGGVGLEDRTNFSFFNAGVHAGKVLTNNYGQGLLRANFEYGVEVLPLWQSYTPTFQRLNCPVGATAATQCHGPTTGGGTYRGVSIVPIILRFNFTHGERIMPWIQGAGGVLYTTRKYPGIGNLNVGDSTQTGPAANTSVWNFTPQGGIGMHYFVKPRRSLDFSLDAEHISSASLGDKNPGVNVSLQFGVGYSWWK